MATDKKENKKLTGEQAVKKIQTLKKDLFNIDLKKLMDKLKIQHNIMKLKKV